MSVDSLKEADIWHNSTALFTLCLCSYMKSEWWYSVCEAVKAMATHLQMYMYASYLESQNELSKKRQSQMTISSDADEAEVIPAT